VTPGTPRRRGVLFSLIAAVLSSKLRPAFAAADSEAFARAAAVLAGNAEVPDFFLAAARSALEASYGPDAVAQFAAAVSAAPAGEALPPEFERMAQALLTMLYTGEIGSSAPYYPWAMAWRALGFANAPGICGGPFGYWTKA
jgi:hypothetical protein